MQKENYTKLSVAEMRSHPIGEERRQITRKAILEVIMYFLFLICMIILVIARMERSMFTFLEVNSKHFLTHEKNFFEVVTRKDWWDFIKDVNELVFGDDPNFVMEENLVLGPPRLRQLRVRPNTCLTHESFERYFNTCYGLFNAANEQKDEEYKGTKYSKPTYFDVLHKGLLTTLTDGGYVQDFTFDPAENEAIIKRLIDIEWFDAATRLIVLELTFYSDNTKLLNNFKLAANVPAIGGMVPYIHRSVVNVFSYWNKANNYHVQFVCVVFYLCFVYNVCEEIKEIYLKRWDYFASIWNYLDLLVMTLCWICVFYHFWHPWYMGTLMQRFEDNPNKFLNMDVMSFLQSYYFEFFAIMIFLQCFRIFKFFNFSKTLVQFTITMTRCGKEIFAFCLLLSIVILAYVIVGMLIFGSYLPDYNNFRSAIASMIKMIVGQLEFEEMERINHIVGPIYYVTYTMAIMFLFVNLFLSILANIYLHVKTEIRTGQLHLTSFLGSSMKNTLTKWKERLSPSRFKKRETAKEFDVSERRTNEIIEEYFETVTPRRHTLPMMAYQEYVADVDRLNSEMTAVDEKFEELISKMDMVLGEKHELFSQTEDLRAGQY